MDGPQTPTKQANSNNAKSLKSLEDAEKEIQGRFQAQSLTSEVARALAVGDFVVDIPSIKGLNKGFRFYSREQLGLDDLLKLKVSTRWVAIVGDYNAGKTFFSCLMMDKPIASDLVVRTPGITVMLSPKEQEEKIASANQSVREKPPALVRELAMLNMKLKREKNNEEKAKIEAQIKEKEEDWKMKSTVVAQTTSAPEDKEYRCTFAILDTAGDDRSCSFAEHHDVRANEMVKRAVIVQTAQTMVFLTSKFDRDSQEKLSCLMAQMTKQRKPASNKNRIIVIHNGIEVHDKLVLQNLIDEVKQCYSLQKTPDVQDWGWEVDKDQETGVTFFKTEYCIHLFLVNHNTNSKLPGVPSEFDGVDHNTKTINRLKTLLRSNIPNLVSYNILPTFTQNLMTQLPLFLKPPEWVPEYSRFYPFEDQPGVVLLSPVNLPTEKDDPDYWKSRTEDTCWTDEVAGKLEEMAFSQSGEAPEFELAKFRVASGVAISDSMRDLEGTWFVSEKEDEHQGATRATIVVVVPGVNMSKERLNPENFKVNFYQRKGELQLRVRIPAPQPPKGCKTHVEAPMLPDTWGAFTCKFPEEFSLDGRGIASFYQDDWVKVVDGALHIHLTYTLEETN